MLYLIIYNTLSMPKIISLFSQEIWRMQMFYNWFRRLFSFLF